MSYIVKIIKREGISGFVIKCIRKIFAFFNPLYISFCPFRIQQNKVIFMNFLGSGYGFDPKYIAEELKSNISLDIVWVIRNKDIIGIPPDIRTVIYKSARYYYEISTAKVWVDDVRKDIEIRKRPGQYYLQTYHGFYPVKKFERDSLKALSKMYIKCAKNDSHMIDLLVSSCEFRTNILKRNFWYIGEIAKCGCPRMKLLINKVNTKEKIYKRYGLDREKMLLIYAPTFRNSRLLDPYNIDCSTIEKTLRKRFGKEFYIMVRLHPGMRNIGLNVKDFFGKDVVDGTDYEDPEEMFAACDVLISDYSDTSFEASVADKIVFLYASDLEIYKKERDLYYDLYSLPFTVCTTNEELVKAIKEIDLDKYQNDIHDFWQRQGLYNIKDPARYLSDWIENKMKQ